MDCNNIYKFYDNHVKYLKQYKNKINYIEIDLETPKSYCNNDNEIIIINEDINNIEDLINISKKYTDNQKYNVNIPALTKIIEPLTKLNNLVGLTDIKIQVFEQVLYLIQNNIPKVIMLFLVKQIQSNIQLMLLNNIGKNNYMTCLIEDDALVLKAI